MVIVSELLTGLAFGIEYFEEAEAWILSLGFFRVIILPEDDDDDDDRGTPIRCKPV